MYFHGLAKNEPILIRNHRAEGKNFWDFYFFLVNKDMVVRFVVFIKCKNSLAIAIRLYVGEPNDDTTKDSLPW